MKVPLSVYPKEREEYVRQLLLVPSDETVISARERVLEVYSQLDPAEKYRAGKWLEVTSKRLR